MTEQEKVEYFSEFEIKNYSGNTITIRSCSFESEVEAERELHRLLIKFEPDNDDEWINGRVVCKEVIPIPRELPTFKEFLEVKDNPSVIKEYPDPDQWVPR